MANGKNDRKKTVIILVAVVIFLITSILGIKIFPNEIIEGELQVHMIDVGQADCFLFIQGDNTALIDCGTRSTGEDAVKYIKELGITKLDYVIGTHPHDDHMGGMYDIITNFEIGKIIIPEVQVGKVTANWYMKLMAEIAQNNYDVQYPEEEDVYSLGDVEMKVLGFMDNPNDTNNYSIVMMMSFGDMDILMTGDAEKDLEKEILQSGENVSAEILKVGHHGSDTSTSDEFLDAVNPEYALISAKVGNKYEHPVKTTMEKLEEKEIEVYRTDECGDVVLTITSDNVTSSTKCGDYLSGPELEEKECKMKSYASIDSKESNVVVCEVELCTIEDSKAEDYAIKETAMIDIPLTMFCENFEEGDIFVVEHDCQNISSIIYKDDEEKRRRIDIIKKLI